MTAITPSSFLRKLTKVSGCEKSVRFCFLRLNSTVSYPDNNYKSSNSSFNHLQRLRRKDTSNFLNESHQTIGKTQIKSYCTRDNKNAIGDYDGAHRKSIEDPENFWGEMAEGIDWFKPYEKVLDNSRPPFSKWYVGGKLNACYNAIDRHVAAGMGTKVAVIHDSPITNSITKITYNELLKKVSHLSGLLSSLGVVKGDRVLIYLPMIPEALIAMLAIARLGAIHSLVFGGFAAPELSTRLAHCNAKVVVSTSYGLEPGRTIHYKPILDEAIRLSSHKPKHCVILQREGKERASMEDFRDIDWMEGVERARPHDAVPVDANDPLYILYTSGTTGAPKGVIRPTGGHCVILPWTMKSLYDTDQSDVWWAASDFGWVVGHSYICYAPLLYGCTTIIYEGKPVGTPDANQFFRVIEDHNVKGMFVAPTALRAITMEDPKGTQRKSKTTSLRNLFVAGEPLDHSTRVWAEEAFGCPALDHWWQTETGSAISAHAVGLGMSRHPPRGSTGKAFVGFDLKVLTKDGQLAQPGELGRIVCKLPLPPGTMSSLFKADQKFIDAYFKLYPGYYDTMDAGMLDKDGYLSVQSREDDVINVAGHRLSTMSLEEVIIDHPDIAEAAVIGIPDELKGEVPFGLFVIKKNCSKTEDQLRKEIVLEIRRVIGPVASFKLCASVAALPKTRSGKIPRKTFADLAKNREVVIPASIEDPKCYDYVLKALHSCGFALDAPVPKLR